jgi:hypothetical protein
MHSDLLDTLKALRTDPARAIDLYRQLYAASFVVLVQAGSEADLRTALFLTCPSRDGVRELPVYFSRLRLREHPLRRRSACHSQRTCPLATSAGGGESWAMPSRCGSRTRSRHSLAREHDSRNDPHLRGVMTSWPQLNQRRERCADLSITNPAPIKPRRCRLRVNHDRAIPRHVCYAFDCRPPTKNARGL